MHESKDDDLHTVDHCLNSAHSESQLRRGHVLKEPLMAVIGINVAEDVPVEAITEEVLRVLDARGYIQYAPKDELALLSASGRTFVCVVDHPDATLRQLSMILGLTESSVAKSIANLVSANLITRTKVKGRNTYRVVEGSARTHSDLRRFHDALGEILDNDHSDSAPA